MHILHKWSEWKIFEATDGNYKFLLKYRQCMKCGKMKIKLEGFI